MKYKLGYRGYIASRKVNGELVPHNVQNLVIREYAHRRGMNYLLSATEMSPENCFIVLNDVLSNLDKIGGIILYSLFMLPKSYQARVKIYGLFLKNKKILHAAMENFLFETETDFQRLEEIFSLAKILNKSQPPQELKKWLN